MIEAETPLEPPRGSFLGHVNVVMLTYLLDGALAFATGIILARALGPEGRGAYGLFVVSAAFGQLLLGLGVGNAAIYYINKREISGPGRAGCSARCDVVRARSSRPLPLPLLAPLPVDVFGEEIASWLLIAAVPVLAVLEPDAVPSASAEPVRAARHHDRRAAGAARCGGRAAGVGG